ncbi:MAG: radical SAM protein [Bacteroidota bacterium]
MLLELQKHIIYGPIKSRRLGRSLGINILPFKKKICTLNCVYCQYGWTQFDAQDDLQSPPWFTIEQIFEAVRTGIMKCAPAPDFLTFSGNGEATMHPDFPVIVDGIIDLKKRIIPGTKTAILTNSTQINDEGVRDAIQKLDYQIMKIDAGTHENFNRFNRPTTGVRFDDIIEGLKSMKNIIIQTMWTEGDEGNFRPDNIQPWLERIKYLSPTHVQIYTLDRGYPSRHISPVSRIDLMRVREMVLKESISAEVY